MALSIGSFAKLAGVSPRTLRHYEQIGLLPAPPRSGNDYRVYDAKLLPRIQRIRKLQTLGFALPEIREILRFAEVDLSESFGRKLAEVVERIRTLQDRKEQLEQLLSVAHRIDSETDSAFPAESAPKPIPERERKQFMEKFTDIVRQEILTGIKARCGVVTESHRRYLERDVALYATPERSAVLTAIKDCVDFARAHGLRLGPGRGSAPASLAFFSLGLGAIDPTHYDLTPERLEALDWNVHIDVEYERGLAFTEYCRKRSAALPRGRIEAFRMPLIDILAETDHRIGHPFDADAIDDDSDLVLAPFRAGDLSRIFLFDASADTLVARVFPEPVLFHGTVGVAEFLSAQSIDSFRDVLNAVAVWRPTRHGQVPERIENYLRARKNPVPYPFLMSELQGTLAPNGGCVLYHEDLIRILRAYTAWPGERCNRLRVALFRKDMDAARDDLSELRRLAPSAVADLIERESPNTFCFAHTVAFGRFTKRTALLKTLHRAEYLVAIDAFESKHALRWDDIGVRTGGVSLLQS